MLSAQLEARTTSRIVLTCSSHDRYVRPFAHTGQALVLQLLSMTLHVLPHFHLYKIH
jgi:hypothetical protein